MRHGNHKFKLDIDTGHRRCLIANMLKALIEHGRITTTIPKAKELRRHADQMITLAKRGTLHTRRKAIAKMMISFNHLNSKQARLAKKGDTSSYNGDRIVVKRLFTELASKFQDRNGGYTRIIKTHHRAGDNASKCIIEFVE